LLVNRFDDPRVAVADVDTHQLTIEVEEALPFGRPEIDALGFRYRQRVDF